MRNKGFTLIELIAIIAVLAILVTIGVPRYLGHTKEANFTKLKHDARIIQDASDRYYIDNNEWPYLLDENGNKLIVSNPKDLTIIYKVEEYNESDLGTDPENDIVLYEIDFDKLKPYIRKLNSDIAYFVAAQGNPEFGITALDPKSESNKDRINITINEGTPEGPGEVGEAIREPDEGEIIIKSAEDLAKIGKEEGYPLGGNYIQMSDIDLSDYNDGEGWVPIGDDTNPFTGNFDGNGFKIRNLYINRPDTYYQGLFGQTRGATITNISLEYVDVTGRNCTGGLVGYAYDSTITNSYATGSVEGGTNTGGLVGHVGSSSAITNSYATGSVTGGNDTGGLVGFTNNSTISNSYATGSVTGASSVGGLVGKMINGDAYSSKVEYSYALDLDLFLIGSKDFGSGGSSDRNIVTDSDLLSDSEMKQANNYSDNWDFDNIWKIDEGQSYPYLRDNPQSPPPGTN